MKKRITEPYVSPSAPDGLSEKSKALWGKVVGTRAKSDGRLVLLEQALKALDRADECCFLVNTEGLFSITTTTGAIHIHPLAKCEREFRQQFFHAWEKLGLHWDDHLDGGMQNYYED